MERMTRLLAWALRRTARWLPSERREWAEAVQAEVVEFPAGWPRLDWLAGGLWLVVKEANVARKVVYWLGVGAIATAAAWSVWLSWLNVPGSDPETGTDRIRILVGVAALLALPWVVRQRGWFGPVGNSVAARLARLAGCAAICGMGIALVRADRSTGASVAYGGVNWLRTIGGLVLLGALVAVPLIIRSRRPDVEASTLWGLTGVAGVCVWALLPLQILAIGYIAAILLATSRRFGLPSALLVSGAIAGVVAALILYALGRVPEELGWLFIALVPVIMLMTAAPAGAVCGWHVRGTENSPELREARIRRGLLVGAVAGACCGLLATNLALFMVFVMAAGPGIGMLGGALGGAFAAMHPLRPRADGSRALGIFASSS
jgi:hypothetical protein